MPLCCEFRLKWPLLTCCFLLKKRPFPSEIAITRSILPISDRRLMSPGGSTIYRGFTGKSMKNQWRINEKPMKNQWNTNENQWNTNENSMKIILKIAPRLQCRSFLRTRSGAGKVQHFQKRIEHFKYKIQTFQWEMNICAVKFIILPAARAWEGTPRRCKLRQNRPDSARNRRNMLNFVRKMVTFIVTSREKRAVQRPTVVVERVGAGGE